MRQTTVKATAWSVGAAALLALAGGCGGETSAERTLREARAQMLALHTGADAAPPTMREQTYKAVAASLQPAAGDLDGAAAASAQRLLADAQAGLGHLRAAEASEHARRLRNLMGRARTAAEHHAAYVAAAQALEGVDTTPQMDALRDLVEDMRADLAELGEVRGITRGELEGVRSRAEAELDSARELRSEAERVRSGAAEASAAERARAAERAFELERRADGHEKQAAEWFAQLAQAEPRADMLDLDYANIEKRIGLVQDAGQRLGQRAAAREEIEAQQRAMAVETAQRFTELLGEVESLLTGPFGESVREGVRSYENAARSMRSAAQILGRQAAGVRAVELAAIRQSLASLQRVEARTLESVAAMMRWAADLEPAMLDGGALRARAGELQSASDAALAAAAESYRTAREDLAASGARGEDAARIEALAQLIAETETALGFGEGAAPESPDAEPEAAPQGGGEG